MARKINWFGRPEAALCLLGGIVILSVFILLNREHAESRQNTSVFSVTFRHYGVDAREIERTIAIPLEDAFSSISGVNRILTLSENSRLRAYLRFRQGAVHYEAVREAAQRIYETLPLSVQRPEFGSSDDSRIPVWTAAVWESSPGAGRFLERLVKPALERLDGAGEVTVSGSGINEVIIALDPEKSASLSLSPRRIASALGTNDGLFSAGMFRDGEREIPLNLDSRYPDLVSLGGAFIPLDSGAAVRLRDMAAIYEQERESESIARLDGKKAAVISLSAASGANLGSLSRNIKKALEGFSSMPLEFHVLQDKGAEEEAAFHSVIVAALQSSIIVAVTAAFLTIKKNSSLWPALVCAAAVPLVSFFSTALLVSLGFPLDKKLLAGLFVGIGAAADAVILSADGFSGDSRDGAGILRRLVPPMFSGAFTTIAALLPLTAFSLAEDIAAIVWALGAVSLVSMALALSILPPLFLWRPKIPRYKKDVPLFPEARNFIRGEGVMPRRTEGLSSAARFFIRQVKRKALKAFAAHVRFSMRRPWLFPALSILISASGCLALFLAGADTAAGGSENSVYARVEFTGGFRKEEGDKLLSVWAAEIKKHAGILSVQTSAMTGSGTILASFDPRTLKEGEARKIIRSSNIPGAFIYIPEASADERSWEITFSGEDDGTCRELAEKAASLCASFPLIRETVLNFKEGNPRLTLFPRRDIFSEGAIPFTEAADAIRRGVYGPVAYKRNGGEKEVDVRIRLSSSPVSGDTETEDILSLPVIIGGPKNGNFRIRSLVDMKRDQEPSVIRREDRRRTASLSVRSSPMDPRVAREKIMGLLKKMEIPPGYAVEFDKEAILLAESLSKTSFHFLLALLFCYMIIAAANESFILPLLVLAAVPPSLAVPVLVLTMSGTSVNLEAACSLIAVSGMAVNASVLTGEGFKACLKNKKLLSGKYAYGLLRSRLPVLAACTGTTVAGTLPFLVLPENSNAIVRVLSLVTVLGVSSSAVCALVLVPSLVKLYSACAEWKIFLRSLLCPGFRF
jgi:multidrug efflux pump subunit AcrB